MQTLTRIAVGAGIVAVSLLGAVAFARDGLVVRESDRTTVKAPSTMVEADERTGETRVEVRATDTKVDVDTQHREVRIRVPFFNGDIRW